MLTRIAVAVLAAAMLAGAASAGGPAPRHDYTEAPAAAPRGDYVIVTLADPPVASYSGGIPGYAATRPQPGGRLDPGAPAALRYRERLARAHDGFRGYLRSKAPAAVVVAEFFYTGNALAVKLNGARPQVLAAGPGVQRVEPSALYRPTMNVSTGLIAAPALWTAPGGGFDGTGIKVGVIDSGIDDTHPFFACKGAIPHKVYASGAAGYDPARVLVNDHGTHVAGTVAGCRTALAGGPVAGPISGVAPGASLYDYNVFPGFGAGWVAFGGSAFGHDIARALEDALLDGMDVVNMSLGGGVQGPHDYLADAVNAAVDAGLVVVAAAGNDGPGDATVASPGSAALALTVGASTNPHFIGFPVTVGGSTFGAALGDFQPYGVLTATYTVTAPANGCGAISTNLAGKIALIDRGDCTFTTKVRNAEAAGAIGVLVVNNVAGDPVAMGHDGSDPFPAIPAAMVGQAEGAAMKPAGTASLDGTAVREFRTTHGDIIAGFSSRGPTPFTYLIKPDVTAPGVNIYSSVLGGQWAMFQGTSMATPHVTGGVALLKQAHPDWGPAEIKSALVQTAARPVWDHKWGTAPTGVMVRGGGRLDLAAATATPVTVHPASASFGRWNGNQAADATLTLSVRNVSTATQACAISLTGAGPVAVAPGALALTAGASATLALTLDAGKADRTPSGDYSGDVLLACGERTLRVPWWVRIDRQGKP